MKSISVFLALIPTIAPVASALAQTPAPPARTAPQESKPRLEAWPALAGEAAKTAQSDVERVRKAHTEEMSDLGRAGLVQAGAGAAPLLLAALGKEKDENVRARLVAILDQVTDATHTRLLAREFTSKSRDVRLYVLGRCALYPDPELRAAAESVLTRLIQSGEKADPDERYVAALCATSTGSTAGLLALHAAAIEGWNKRGVQIRAALEGVRGAAASAVVVGLLKDSDTPKANDPLLPKADRQRVVACLNLLAGCGDKSTLSRARAFLDSNDNTVRVAAINAVLGIAENKPPVADLSAFEAVELAKKLKN